MLRKSLKGEMNIRFNINGFKEYLEKNFLSTAKETSKTNQGISLITNDEIKLLSLDEATNYLKEEGYKHRSKCYDCTLQNSEPCRCTSLENLSTDGLYINLIEECYPELYFIEFKKWNIYEPDDDSNYILEDINGILSTMDKHINNEDYMNKVEKTLKQSIKKIRSESRLRIILKSFESLFCVLPSLYGLYCINNNINNNNINSDIQGFKSFLSKCYKEYIIVFEQRGDDLTEHVERIRNESSCENNIFQLQRYRPYPFNNIRLFGLEEEFNSFIKEITA